MIQRSKQGQLDLHGARHGDVDILVENFILLNQADLPLEIICGKSDRMINLVMDVVNRVPCKTARINRDRGTVTIDII